MILGFFSRVWVVVRLDGGTGELGEWEFWRVQCRTGVSDFLERIREHAGSWRLCELRALRERDACRARFIATGKNITRFPRQLLASRFRIVRLGIGFIFRTFTHQIGTCKAGDLSF